MSSSKKSFGSKRGSVQSAMSARSHTKSSQAKIQGQFQNLEVEQYEIGDADLNVSANVSAKSRSKLNSTWGGSTKNKWRKEKLPITLAQQREQQRLADVSHMGPGTHDTLKPMGHQVQGHISMGSKYEFKPDQNPGVGVYDTDAAHKHTKPKLKGSAMQTQARKTDHFLASKVHTSEPGAYHKNEDFNRVKTVVNFGAKYKFSPVKGPPPGAYNPDSGIAMSQKKSRAAHIREDTYSYRRPVDHGPSPDKYKGHVDFIGHITHKMPFGGNYVFKPDSNPGTGHYRPNESQTSPKVKGGIIHRQTSPERRPVAATPGPACRSYSALDFGSDIKHKMPFGDKYVFKPDTNPPPGKYNPNMSQILPRTKSAVIHQETSPYRRGPDITPSPGHHDSHLAPFGSDITHTMNFGDKYKPFVSQTPACTKYNPDDSFLSTRKKSPAAHIRASTMAFDQDIIPASPPKYQQRSFQMPQ